MDGNKYLNWLFISVPVGLVGSVLVGISSELLVKSQEKLRSHANRQLFNRLAQLTSWVGLAGVGFPLSIVGLELWHRFNSQNT